MQSWYRSPDRVYRLRADDKAASLAWQRCMSSAMEQYSRFGAWADRDAAAKAQFFEQVSAASVVSGASAKPLSAKFAPKFKVRPHRPPVGGFAWLSDRPCAQVLQEAVVRKGFHASSEQCASLQARPRFYQESVAPSRC